jgi:hypothetical protein
VAHKKDRLKIKSFRIPQVNPQDILNNEKGMIKYLSAVGNEGTVTDAKGQGFPIFQQFGARSFKINHS